MGKRSATYTPDEEEKQDDRIMGIPKNVLILVTIIAFVGGSFVYFTFTTTEVTPPENDNPFIKQIKENTYGMVHAFGNTTDEVALNISADTSEVVALVFGSIPGTVDDIMNSTIDGVVEITGEQWGNNLVFRFKSANVLNITKNIESNVGNYLGTHRIYNAYLGRFTAGIAPNSMNEVYVLSEKKLDIGDIFIAGAENVFIVKKGDRSMKLVSVEGYKIQSGDTGIDAVVLNVTGASFSGKIRSDFDLDSLEDKVNASISYTPPKISVDSALSQKDIDALNGMDGVNAKLTVNSSTTITINIANVSENESESYVTSTKAKIDNVIGNFKGIIDKQLKRTPDNKFILDQAVSPEMENEIKNLTEIESIAVVRGKTEIVFNNSLEKIKSLLDAENIKYDITDGSLSFTIQEGADIDSVKKVLENFNVRDIEVQNNGFVSIPKVILLNNMITPLKDNTGRYINDRYQAILNPGTKAGDRIKVEIGATIQTMTMPDGTTQQRILGLGSAVEMDTEAIKTAEETKNVKTEEKQKMKTAILETNKGTIKFELYEDKAPKTVANFVKLAGDRFYEGLVFHRVIPGFMIQGGGFYPEGTQKASPYGAINLEISPELIHDDGAVAMARTSDPNSATSQFYICDGPQHSLDGNYAVFGKVIEGMNVVRLIANVNTTTKYQSYADWPEDDVVIKSVTILDAA